MTTQLEKTPTYPHRVPFFANRFKRALTNCGARRVGLLGYFILSHIAEVEDSFRCTVAPLFWINEFVNRCGRNRNAVSMAIRECVAQGWLHWEQKNDRTQAIAWVKVPPEFQHFLESSLSYEERMMLQARDPQENVARVQADQDPDRSPASNQFVQENVAQNESGDFVHQNVAHKVAGNVAHKVAGNVAHKVAGNVAPSSLVPIPLPLPPSSEKTGRAGGGEDLDLAEELVRLGVTHAVEAARAGLSLCTLQQIRAHLDHFRSKPGAWGPVIVYRRLVSPILDRLAPDDGWPAPLPAYVEAERIRREASQRSEQRDAEAQTEEGKKAWTQLLIDWERDYQPVINAMTTEQVLDLAPNAFLREHLRRSKDWRIPKTTDWMYVARTLYERDTAKSQAS